MGLEYLYSNHQSAQFSFVLDITKIRENIFISKARFRQSLHPLPSALSINSPWAAKSEQIRATKKWNNNFAQWLNQERSEPIKPVLKVTGQPWTRTGTYQITLASTSRGGKFRVTYTPPTSQHETEGITSKPVSCQDLCDKINLNSCLPGIIISSLANDRSSVKMIFQENKQQSKHNNEGCGLINRTIINTIC